MVAAVVALVESYVFAGFAGEALEHVGTDALIAWTVERELGVLGVLLPPLGRAGIIAECRYRAVLASAQHHAPPRLA